MNVEFQFSKVCKILLAHVYMRETSGIISKTHKALTRKKRPMREINVEWMDWHSNMATTKSETIYKPKYNGSMRFAMILYPVWLGLFGYFLYQVIVTRSYN